MNVLNKKEMDKKIDELHEWIKTQPHLPQKLEKGFLKLFVQAKDGDLDAAKELLEKNINFRQKYADLLLNRDPLADSTHTQLELESMIQLPGRTPQNYKLFLNRLNDHDPAKFNFDESIKIFFMTVDVTSVVDDEDFGGEIILFDMTGVTLRHQLKSSISTVRIFMKGVQEAFPVRPKEIHVINANSLIDVVVRLVKPFMRSDLFNMLHIHMPNSEKPYENFPRDMMPDEYGGKAGKIADLHADSVNKFAEMREYLIGDNRWKLNVIKDP